MHNLKTVMRFEIRRTLKKKSFWISALAIPVVAGLVGVVIYFSNTTTHQVGEELSNERYSLGITDSAHLVAPGLAASLSAHTFTSKSDGIAAVRQGKLDAYFYYPANISTQPVEIYGKEVGLFKNGRYEGLAQALLTQSTLQATSPTIRTILQEKVNFTTKTYTDGQEDKGFLKLIVPGAFLVLFYFMIVTFGNQMLTSITEEKENRVIEMILVTIKPKTLLLGKLFSLVLLALLQLAIILLPVLAGYLLFKQQLSLPNVNLADLPFDPLAISLGAIIFIVSFLMYSGILMTLGAAMPTAKEANNFFGVVMACTFAPLYAAPLFISSPDSPLVQVLSYFPLSSPIPLLLRNAVGTLSLQEAAIAIALLLLTTSLAIGVGVRIFKYGVLEYNRKLSTKEVFGRR